MVENNTAVTTILESFWQKPKHIEKFPITSIEDLKSWEQSINDKNKDEMVSIKPLKIIFVIDFLYTIVRFLTFQINF